MARKTDKDPAETVADQVKSAGASETKPEASAKPAAEAEAKAEAARPELADQEIAVIGPTKGRFRSVGGKAVKFGSETTVIKAADLSEDEARAIRDDPTLTVVPVAQ